MAKQRMINGKPTVYATQPITLHVKQYDVDRGDPNDPGGCAAARCIKRELRARAAFVHKGRVYIFPIDNDVCLVYQTPKGLWGELIAYDRGGRFMPGEFRIPPVSPSNRPGMRSKRKADSRTGPHHRNKTKRPRHVTAHVRHTFGANR